MTRKIAIFDFDGTIYNGDSFIDFAVFSRGRGRFLKALVKTFPRLLGWKAGICSNSSAKEGLFGALYRGLDGSWFAAQGKNFAAEIDKKLRAEIVGQMEQHVRSGHEVFILTASVPQWIEPWASARGVTVVGTEAGIDGDGRLSGRFVTPNCYGEEKLRRIKEMCPDFDRAETWAYGDSSGDLPILAAVTHPLKV